MPDLFDCDGRNGKFPENERIEPQSSAPDKPDADPVISTQKREYDPRINRHDHPWAALFLYASPITTEGEGTGSAGTTQYPEECRAGNPCDTPNSLE